MGCPDDRPPEDFASIRVDVSAGLESVAANYSEEACEDKVNTTEGDGKSLPHHGKRQDEDGKGQEDRSGHERHDYYDK